jgi:hypothetical protein
MRRFSIFGLMGFVLASGVGFAALRDANEAWASLMGLVTLALLGVAALGVVHGRGRGRAWWLGFLLFGGGYHCLAAGPWVADQVRPTLPTTHLLYFVHIKVAGTGTGTITFYTTTTTTTLPNGSTVLPRLPLPTVSSVANGTATTIGAGSRRAG